MNCTALRTEGAGRLLVSLPPRNGKSKAISIAWVAWMLARTRSSISSV